jgi:hypothetical protein
MFGCKVSNWPQLAEEGAHFWTKAAKNDYEFSGRYSAVKTGLG